MFKTKWIPLLSYMDDYAVFIVLCRKNKRTGMLYFKTKRINRIGTLCHCHPTLNVDDQLRLIMEES